jgi:hypothetical protein
MCDNWPQSDLHYAYRWWLIVDCEVVVCFVQDMRRWKEGRLAPNVGGLAYISQPGLCQSLSALTTVDQRLVKYTNPILGFR